MASVRHGRYEIASKSKRQRCTQEQEVEASWRWGETMKRQGRKGERKKWVDERDQEIWSSTMSQQCPKIIEVYL
jgi:hypothetical protein